jgi:altronate dehydratase small subunit
MQTVQAIQIAVADNVATAVRDIRRGDTVIVRCPCGEIRRTVVVEPIPFGHKFALAEITRGAPAVKYGAVIGTATEDIRSGAYVHTHNLVGNRARRVAGGAL